MVINIRGTSGSGKTTVVRGLMAAGDISKLYGPDIPDGTLFGTKPGKLEAYRVDLAHLSSPVFIMGSYENVCGGCDSILSQDGICDRVRQYAPQGHVVMEGLLMSHLFSRYAALDRELTAAGHGPYIWGFLDTPLEICLHRVEQRRQERGATKPLNPKNTTQKWHDMRRVFAKCEAAGLDVRWVPYQTATETVRGWLT